MYSVLGNMANVNERLQTFIDAEDYESALALFEQGIFSERNSCVISRRSIQSRYLSQLFELRDFESLILQAIRMKIKIEKVLGIFPDFMSSSLKNRIRAISVEATLQGEDKKRAAEALVVYCQYYRSKSDSLDAFQKELLDTVLVYALVSCLPQRSSELKDVLVQPPHYFDLQTIQQVLHAQCKHPVLVLILYRSHHHHVKILQYIKYNHVSHAHCTFRQDYSAWIGDYIHDFLHGTNAHTFDYDFSRGYTVKTLTNLFCQVVQQYICLHPATHFKVLFNNHELHHLESPTSAKYSTYAEADIPIHPLGITPQDVAECLFSLPIASFDKESSLNYELLSASSILSRLQTQLTFSKKKGLLFLKDIDKQSAPVSNTDAEPSVVQPTLSSRSSRLAILYLDAICHRYHCASSTYNHLFDLLIRELQRFTLKNVNDAFIVGNSVVPFTQAVTDTLEYDVSSIMYGDDHNWMVFARIVLCMHLRWCPDCDVDGLVSSTVVSVSSMPLCERILLHTRRKEYDKIIQVFIQVEGGIGLLEQYYAIIYDINMTGCDDLLLMLYYEEMIPQPPVSYFDCSREDKVKIKNAIDIACKYYDRIDVSKFICRLPKDTPFSSIAVLMHDVVSAKYINTRCAEIISST